MLDHMAGFALAFTAAANHTEPPGGSRPPSASASRLADDWRTLIPAGLAEMADAWRDEAAWSGMTKAGGQDLPSEIAGVLVMVALTGDKDLARWPSDRSRPVPVEDLPYRYRARIAGAGCGLHDCGYLMSGMSPMHAPQSRAIALRPQIECPRTATRSPSATSRAGARTAPVPSSSVWHRRG
jgi:hypothetical protein